MLNYFKTLKNLYALYNYEEEDEEVYIKECAINKARDIITNLFNLLGWRFSYCTICDGYRGLDLVWDNSKLKRRVWVIVPYIDKEIPYIFYRGEGITKFTEDFTIDKLATLLSNLDKDNFI